MNLAVVRGALISFSVAWLGTASAAELPASLQDLYAPEISHPPACASLELQKLRAAVEGAAKSRAPADAWALTEALLCGDGKRAERFVLAHMPARIVQSAYATGEEAAEVITQPRDVSVMLRKQAWKAEAQQNGADLQINYLCGQVCMGSFTLRFAGKTWLLVGVGQAED